MGSRQSQPSILPTDATVGNDQHIEIEGEIQRSPRKPPRDESSFARAQRKCNKKKRAYDACYTAQLSGKGEECDDLFEAYRTCFLRCMSKDMESRGVAVKEGSMIAEYKEEIKDVER
ncbi:hypothetical protein ACHAXS_007255 [Conticribra weissflogii]